MSPSESAVYHPEERALLRAVAASPADDLPRFIYADWLDDHGFSIRAELIRLQCRIAELETGPREVMDRHVEMWSRQQHILDHHWDEIVGPLNNLVPYIEAFPIRGLLAEIDLEAYRFHRFSEMLVEMLPVPQIAVYLTDEVLPDLQGMPNLEAITSLRVEPHPYRSGAALVENLVALSPRLEKLASLSLCSCRLRNHDVDWLIHAKFPRLTSLDLSSNPFDEIGACRLLASQLVAGLQHVNLAGIPLSDRCIDILVDTMNRNPRLRILNLRETELSVHSLDRLRDQFGTRLS